eukprot:CAMPEP_0170071720 /NCGR_PEP_ID=MMETSP0019_2-20121128/9555_1 /TAXON_ID=98059 /ORGANISM="Dinobryon sp., Strain UTEXLB2267" /LENGTH=43 /DNA_ID= /DNA_START= /DNA_END= /DNA_ORIENTATION=
MTISDKLAVIKNHKITNNLKDLAGQTDSLVSTLNSVRENRSEE